MIENRSVVARTPSHTLALDCVEAGIEAAHPQSVVDRTLARSGSTLVIDDHEYDLDAYDDVLVVGGGNAAGWLATALESRLGDHVDGGAVVTDDPAPTRRIDVLPGDHPIPSERGVASARRVLEVAERAGTNDLILGCLTGGGSALLPAPAADVILADLQNVTEALLESGATIDEINAVRKHCSAIKGGRLAHSAAPATVVVLVISDVIGDDLGTIASGPFAPDPTTYNDARSVLDRYGIDPPDAVESRLERGIRGEIEETPTADDPAFDRVRTHVLANGRTALSAASTVAADRGYEPLILSTSVRGEAAESATTHVAIAEESRTTGTPIEPPAVVLSGGETTVNLVDDHGIGGPNGEFALSAAIELETGPLDGDGIVVAAVDTDGIDGPSGVAGAIVDADTVEVDEARRALGRNDALPTLRAANATIETGRTGTNVNDLRVIVIDR